MTARKGPRWSLVILLVLLAAATADPSLARLEGKLKKGVYVAPAKNFSVAVSRGTRARDGHDKKNREAFVELTDRAGYFNAIWCTPFERNETIDEILVSEERATKSFTNYFRDVIMPWIFHPISPDSAVLSSTVLSFEGAPAYLFLVNVPGASGLWNMQTTERFAGRRATLLFNKCGYTYIVIHELVAGLGGANRIVKGDKIPDSMIQRDLADGEAALRRFIATVSFAGCP